jgi:hypothetical protein
VSVGQYAEGHVGPHISAVRVRVEVAIRDRLAVHVIGRYQVVRLAGVAARRNCYQVALVYLAAPAM